ncbi:hypothetical protein E2C01_016873 [Portunus trituberculatus]|uniref:Uncharacterized protein n=1 Tax=Portunus trituberculatus TaxID=210409 RepID=A0A5B7DQX6_PORTR|nr:hypothetical protein [Portunus trituberculatus]
MLSKLSPPLPPPQPLPPPSIPHQEQQHRTTITSTTSLQSTPACLCFARSWNIETLKYWFDAAPESVVGEGALGVGHAGRRVVRKVTHNAKV